MNLHPLRSHSYLFLFFFSIVNLTFSFFFAASRYFGARFISLARGTPFPHLSPRLVHTPPKTIISGTSRGVPTVELILPPLFPFSNFQRMMFVTLSPVMERSPTLTSLETVWPVDPRDSVSWKSTLTRMSRISAAYLLQLALCLSQISFYSPKISQSLVVQFASIKPSAVTFPRPPTAQKNRW